MSDSPPLLTISSQPGENKQSPLSRVGIKLVSVLIMMIMMVLLMLISLVSSLMEAMEHQQ